MDFKKFNNPFYEDISSRKHIKEILPNYGFHKLRVWEEYFFRWFKSNDNMIRLNGIIVNNLSEFTIFNFQKLN